MARWLIPGTLVLGVVALAGWGCGSRSSIVRIECGGATFINPLMQKWSGAYKTAKNIEIDYLAKGSGYGITNVTSKNFVFGCSDAPMTKRELDEAIKAGGPVLHVPLAVGAVAVVYNLPGVNELKISGDVLADIYLRKITRWNDPRLIALNPGVNLPNADITPLRRNESSGTTNIFTEYLSKKSPEFAKNPGASKDPKWPPGVEGKPGNDGIAEAVKNTPYTIGYVELAYAKTAQIPAALLINKANQPVAPDARSVTAAVEAAIQAKEDVEPYNLHPLAFSFTDAAGEAAYPIVGASYAILFQRQPRDQGPATVEFLKWAVSDGQRYATELHYAPLPAELTKKAQELLESVIFE
ncbi:MAG: phosphate ABC transporter substrate-binding protein PstS [Gemmataceae bacterium]|nr:phosphate ABC transporter substrate-binding protein PstS [Gemmata sp.]MDW8197383.1 phosphate ABC transporter substrate-binding protein PstS [Gemmataceae bacterium]